jgi:hypothetical protein
MRYGRAVIALIAFLPCTLRAADLSAAPIPQVSDPRLAETVVKLQQAVDAAVTNKNTDDLREQLIALRIP